MVRDDVTEREFAIQTRELEAVRSELERTRKQLTDAEDALSSMHTKYEEQQAALASAMAGWYCRLNGSLHIMSTTASYPSLFSCYMSPSIST